MFRSKKRYEKQQRDELRKQTRIMGGEDPWRVQNPNGAALGDGIAIARKVARAATKATAAKTPATATPKRSLPDPEGLVYFFTQSWSSRERRQCRSALKEAGITHTHSPPKLFVSLDDALRAREILQNCRVLISHYPLVLPDPTAPPPPTS